MEKLQVRWLMLTPEEMTDDAGDCEQDDTTEHDDTEDENRRRLQTVISECHESSKSYHHERGHNQSLKYSILKQLIRFLDSHQFNNLEDESNARIPWSLPHVSSPLL